MINYIISATAIWLLCLLVFETLLKHNNLHRWNRIYLLFSFALGALVPLVNLSGTSFKPAVVQQYDATVTTAANVIQYSMLEPVKGWEPTDILLVVYLVGVLVGFILLVNEVMRLLWFQQYGHRKEINGIKVIETQLNHPPFSFFSSIFIGNAENYTAEELHFIIVHEKVHHTFRHSADRLLMQLAKVLFWFHPLVWRYQKLLSLVHEYQADEVASAGGTLVYGRFIVEQAMLKGAPTISNPINYSPVKNRIRMMTKNQSSTRQGWKYALMLPVVACSILFFSQTSFSGDVKREGKYIYANGNKLELQYEKPPVDTIMMIDPVTGNEKTIVTRMSERVVKLNGKRVYAHNEVTKTGDIGYPPGSKANDFIIKKVLSEFSDLRPGDYIVFMNGLLLDEKGKVIYVESILFDSDPSSYGDPDVEAKMKAYGAKLVDMMMKERWSPAMKDGKPVPSWTEYFNVEVKK